jgi:RNA polymerase sigma factor (sigma-70 family)
MRSVVIDLIREQRAARRGGDIQRMTLSTTILDRVATDDEPLAVDEALTELAEVDPRLSQVLEMRYFGGFSDAEIAAALGMSARTVRRDCEKARLLIRAMLTG